MTNLILIAVLAAIVGGASWYIYKSKRDGVKCIGCPQGCKIPKHTARTCGGSCAGCTGGCGRNSSEP
ncbi:MAG: FeoB-associated Cys-rich membrane protein [Clostridia bacterium]|nr:FeoB-associated Cys-rich membrane protein [Clostridia bacterium]